MSAEKKGFFFKFLEVETCVKQNLIVFWHIHSQKGDNVKPVMKECMS